MFNTENFSDKQEKRSKNDTVDHSESCGGQQSEDACQCGHDHSKPEHDQSRCSDGLEQHGNSDQCQSDDHCSCGHDHSQHHVHEHDEICNCGQDHGHEHGCEVAPSSSLESTGLIPQELKSEAESFIVSGIDCPECAKGVQKSVARLNGVSHASYNFSTSILRVVHYTANEAIMATVEKMGYKIVHRKSIRDSITYIPWWKEKRAVVTGIATLFWLVGIMASIADATPGIRVFVLGVAIAFGAFYPAKSALMAIRNGMALDMNVLMVVAVLGAIYLGEYFEAATVSVLFSIGKMLESYSMDKTRQSIRSLMDLAPLTAIVRRNGCELELPVEDIAVGEIVIVKPGMKIAVDGDVVAGISSVNQAPITGESLPVNKEVDDEVFAGTINEEGYLEVKVTRGMGDTTLDQIIMLVEEAQSQRAPSQQFVDVFAKYYTPIVILGALGIVAVPPLFLGADFQEWLYRGISLLVVSCPCALVISTPVSIVSAIGNAAKHGILIKGGAYLELAGKLKAIALDKTGTLTKGKPRVTAVESLADLTEDQVLQLAATVEEASQHPLAKAVVRYAAEKNITVLPMENFLSLTGKGVQAEIAGKKCVICKPDYAAEQLNIDLSSIAGKIQVHQEQGHTTMIVIYDDKLMGIIAVADMLREESYDTIKQLQRAGIKNTIMLTGDNQQTAATIAKKLSLSEFRANLMPDQKVEVVNKLIDRYQTVAMVGDGVNDAPALATSSVGIAMGGAGTDTALETADIVLMADDLKKLPYTMLLSRKTLNIIKQNIIFSLVVKLAAILLVFPGWLTLWIAILADTGAAIIVILNGMRLLRIKPIV